MTWGSLELEPEVAQWTELLSDEDFPRVMFYLDLLEDQGVLLDHPYTSQLRGKLRELRFHLAPAGASGSVTTSPVAGGSCC